MHHSIDTILKRLRQDIAAHLSPESILSASRAAGHRWRKCILREKRGGEKGTERI